MAAALTAVTDRVHLAQTALVNWTLVVDDGGVLLIDAGYPGHREDVVDSVRRLGFGIADIRAILLTHAHVDHFGSAIWFAETHGIAVYAHPDEVGHARRDYLEQVSPVDVARHAWQPRWLKWSLTISRKGGSSGRYPHRAGAHRRGGRDPARHAAADSHAGPHGRALFLRRRRGVGQR